MIVNFSNIGSGSGSGGVTTGQVMDMITSAITAEEETLYTELQNSIDIPIADEHMTGLTPTDLESNDGSIVVSTNGTYWEGFNKEDVFIQRKGVYNRTLNVPALSAFTDAQEGDIAVVISGSTGETVVHLTGEQLEGLFTNGGWVAGTTYKISADTATATPYRTQLAGTFTTTNANLRLQFGYKEGETTSGYYTNILTTNNTKTDWDGSEITFTIPEYTEWALVQNYNGEGMVDLIDVYTTVGGTQTQTQYNRVNGEWVEPASKDYVNNVVGDIETLLSNI